MKNDEEDGLKDNDVSVACSLRRFLLLLHMLLFVVDVLIVLLRHPASCGVLGAHEWRKHSKQETY